MAQAQELEVRLDGARVTTFAIGGAANPTRLHPASRRGLSRAIEEPLQVRFRQGRHARSASRSRNRTPQSRRGRALPGVGLTTTINFEMGLDYVHIGGPHNAVAPGETPSRRLIFTCRPARPAEEDACARF
jgi:hypothetical protein